MYSSRAQPVHGASQPISIPSRSRPVPAFVRCKEATPMHPLAAPPIVIIPPPSMIAGSPVPRAERAHPRCNVATPKHNFAASTTSLHSTGSASSLPPLTSSSALALHLIQVEDFHHEIVDEEEERQFRARHPRVAHRAGATRSPRPTRSMSDPHLFVGSAFTPKAPVAIDDSEEDYDDEDPTQQCSSLRRKLVGMGLAFDLAVHRAKRRVQRGLSSSSPAQ